MADEDEAVTPSLLSTQAVSSHKDAIALIEGDCEEVGFVCLRYKDSVTVSERGRREAAARTRGSPHGPVPQVPPPLTLP